MAKWFVAAKKADFDSIGKKYHISPVLARIMRNRELITEEQIERYLYGGLKDLYDPGLLKGMETAVSILKEKIGQQKPIRIIGDYDADGICSAYILKKGLSLCGGNVDTAIPDRIRDGYGINEELIQKAFEEGIDTIVTCDNGIAAAEQFRLAASLGMTCIVTDHHEIPYREEAGGRSYLLPEVAAVIDPKQPDCPYPYKSICGAVVAWKLVLRLWQEFAVSEAEEARRELLELAGFATVCDVMELMDENRVIVKEALKSMKNSANVGLRALLKVHDIQTENLSAYHIGFVLGPCLNATGRLDTAQRAIELLSAETEREAICIAAELKKLNESRKEMTERGIEEGISLIEENHWEKDKVMVVYLPECHESLAGIIAGRLRERYYKPVFVLTRGEGCVKGSARSIETYSMYEEMTKCRELFLKYGGHKLAAGLSMKAENIDLFREKINAICTLTEEDMEEKILIDVPMPFSYATPELIEELNLLEPFGMGNPKPVFAQREVRFLSMRIMGRNKTMAKFTVMDEGQNRFVVVLFRNLSGFQEDVEAKYGRGSWRALAEGKTEGLPEPLCMNVIYYPSINEYMGRRELQFVMQNWI